MKEKKLISLIVYVYNDETTINDFLATIIDKTASIFEQLEIIIVNDASTDSTISILKSAPYLKNYPVSIVQMSFHQGVELSMNAGLDLSTGDFVFEFDAAINDFDSELIEQAYHKILEGNDIVSVSPSISEKLTSRLFYSTYNYFSKSTYKLRTDRFRVLSRRAINRAFSISATIPYRKAMYINSGLKVATIEFAKKSLQKRNSEKSYLRNKTAIDTLIIYTNIAFTISVSVALLLLFCTLSIIVYTLFIYFGKDKPIEGWTTLMLLISGSFSGLFLLIAIVIKYLSLLLEIVFKKKTYIQENIEKL